MHAAYHDMLGSTGVCMHRGARRYGASLRKYANRTTDRIVAPLPPAPGPPGAPPRTLPPK